MTPLVPIALACWIPLVVVLYAFVPARTAATFSIIVGWLMLPPFTLQIGGLPDFSKVTASAISIVIGTLFFGADRLTSFRPRWFDIPILLWCLTAIPTSLYNGLGLYDGLSVALNWSLVWGLPYLLGRIYFGTPENLQFFTVGMIIGGLIYVPLCLWEMRMSPTLLANTYGSVKFTNVVRMGGYRPHVFFADGLECGMWMTAASLVAWWLWYSGAIKRIATIPLGSVLLPILLITTILCRSTGALLLLAIGTAMLWISRRFKTRLLLTSLILVGPAYVGVRSTNLWTGQQAVDLAKSLFGADRAQSLEYRLMCENLLLKRALQQPIFGWGTWAGSAVFFDEARTQYVPTDGFWIIALKSFGFLGLTLFYVSFVLPSILFLWRFPPRMWGDPRLAAGLLAVCLLGMYMIDCLMNAFPNIIYMTLAGGLIGLERKQLRSIDAPQSGAAGRRNTRSTRERRGAGSHSKQLEVVHRYRVLGRSFKREGQLDQANGSWQQALDLLNPLLENDPGNVEIRQAWCDCANDLAWLRANHPDLTRRNPISAVAMARRTVEHYPESAAYWNTLGVALYRAGDAQASVTALDHAKALGGGTAFDSVFLSMAYAHLGDLLGAREELALAMFQAEREFPDHAELAGFCNEAQAILAVGAITPTAAHSLDG